MARTLKSHAETLDHLATPVAIFDRDQRLQFYNQAFVRLWDLDLGFLESHPDHNELLDKLRSQNKLPEQLNWRNWKEQVLSVYRALDTQTNRWHLPNGQTLQVIATAHPQGGVTWVFENLTEQVDLETRYNTLVKVQGETIDHLARGRCRFRTGWPHSPVEPGFPCAVGHYRRSDQARHAYQGDRSRLCR